MKEGQKFAPGDQRARNNYFRPENIRAVNAFLAGIRHIADAHGATLAQLVINWTIRRPGITVALVGARNAAQAEENAQAGKFKLADAEIDEINARLDELKLKL